MAFSIFGAGEAIGLFPVPRARGQNRWGVRPLVGRSGRSVKAHLLVFDRSRLSWQRAIGQALLVEAFCCHEYALSLFLVLFACSVVQGVRSLPMEIELRVSNCFEWKRDVENAELRRKFCLERRVV